MNGRVLLYAIAGAEEQYLRESEQFSGIAASFQAQRKRTRRYAAAVGLASVVCIAVFVSLRLASPSFLTPAPSAPTDLQKPAGFSSGDDFTDSKSDTEEGKETVLTTTEQPSVTGRKTESPSSDAVDAPHPTTTNPTNVPEPGTAAPVTDALAPTEPSDSLMTPPKTTAPTQLPTEKPTEKQTEPPTEPSPGGTPGAVYTKRDVSYSEAREIFGHPIVSYSGGGFLGYQVGVVSRGGDVNSDGAFCLDVNYVFADGIVNLTDQDRLTGSAASAAGTRYDYRGKTFYVQTPEDYGSYGSDQIHVGYYPSWDSGVAYQAVFNADADPEEIMDLILSVEF